MTQITEKDLIAARDRLRHCVRCTLLAMMYSHCAENGCTVDSVARRINFTEKELLAMLDYDGIPISLMAELAWACDCELDFRIRKRPVERTAAEGRDE